MLILWSCQNMKKDFTIAFLSSRRSRNIYGMSNSESGWRSYALEKMSRCRDFRLSKVPTCVGTSGKPEEICSGVWGYPYVRSSDKSWKFWLSGVPTQVGTSDYRKFRQVSRLSGSLKKPARVSGVIPTSGVSIRTVPNSWKTWEISLGEVFYCDKTTPSIYMRGS